MQEQSKDNTPIEEVKPAGYKVISVLLLESTFTRQADFDFNIQDITHELKVTPVAHETAQDHKFAVTLNLSYSGLQNEKYMCNSNISMVGFFEKYGEPLLSEEKFKAINAPAIIYPFIREHLFNLCLKAGIANVLLPTVNFKP